MHYQFFTKDKTHKPENITSALKIHILSFGTSNANKAHGTRDSLSSSYSQVVLIYLCPLRCNLLLQPQIAKKP